jgi:hypothetical protein
MSDRSLRSFEKIKTNTGKNACATRNPVKFVQIVAQALLPVLIAERLLHGFLRSRPGCY